MQQRRQDLMQQLGRQLASEWPRGKLVHDQSRRGKVLTMPSSLCWHLKESGDLLLVASYAPLVRPGLVFGHLC